MNNDSTLRPGPQLFFEGSPGGGESAPREAGVTGVPEGRTCLPSPWTSLPLRDLLPSNFSRTKPLPPPKESPSDAIRPPAGPPSPLPEARSPGLPGEVEGGGVCGGVSPPLFPARRFRRANWPRARDDMDCCGDQFRDYACPDGHGHYAAPHTCKNRLCPKCARRRHMELYHRYLPWVQTWKWPLHLVLTLRVSTDLKASIDLALSSFSKLRRSFPSLGRGIKSCEINPKGDTEYYVHLHVLADCEWLDGESVGDAWKALTGSYVKKIRRVGPKWSNGRSTEGALLEVTKYVSKGMSRKAGPLADLQAQAVYQSTYGRRLVTYWGLGEDSSLLDTQEIKIFCPVCGRALKYVGTLSIAMLNYYQGEYIYFREVRYGP